MTQPFVIRAMVPDDLTEVMELEKLCFPTPWTANAYRHELRNNPNSYYCVMHGVRTLYPALPAILSYGGFWILDDEAHIVTIATHPAWRRKKLAELLLLTMIEQARTLGVAGVTLEVREQNLAAQQLYRGLGFVEVGRRKGYYPATQTHPREDAILLTLNGVDHEAVNVALAARHEVVTQTATRLLLAG